MNQFTKLTKLALLGGLLSSFMSCKQDDLKIYEPRQEFDNIGIVGNNTYEEKSIEPVNPGEDQVLDLYGELDSFKNAESDTNETRSLHVGNQEYNINGYPLIYRKSIEENWGIFYFKKIGSTTITKRALPYTIQPLDEDGNEVDEGRRARIKITARPATKKDNPKVNSINLDNGETFADGEWYMSGLLGTGESLKNGAITQQKFNSYSIDAPVDPDNGNQKLSNAIEWDASSADKISRQINVPLKLMWSKLKGTTDNVAGRNVGGASAKDLKFAVTGALISFRSRSDIFDDVYLHGMYIKSWNLSFSGHFSESNLNNISDDMLRNGSSLPYEYRQTDSQTPDRTTGVNWNFMRANFFAKSNSGTKYSFLIPGGGQANSQLKIVAMPIVPPTSEYYKRNQTHVGWIISKSGKRIEAATSTLQTLSIKNNTNPNPLRSEDGSTTFDTNAIHEGRYYNFNVDMETDLMITEVFSHNPSGRNYGWVELYNGTMHTIDLSNYALGKSEYEKYSGHYYYIPVPNETTAHGSHVGGGFGQAIVMPLTMESTTVIKNGRLEYQENLFNSSLLKRKWYDEASGTITAMGIKPASHINEYYKGREKVYVGDFSSHSTNKYHNDDFTYQQKSPEEKRMLPPGKTIIILMYGYFRDHISNTEFTSSVSQHSDVNNVGPAHSKYLHGPQMERAYKAGYLHDIVLSYSGANESFDAPGYYTHGRTNSAPVLSKTDTEGLFLVRILPSGHKRFIDAFGPVNGNSNSSVAFYNKTKINKMIYVRKEQFIFPNYGATIDEWDISIYQSGWSLRSKYWFYPKDSNVKTSAGTRVWHENIKPNYPDKYDGTDRYTPKQRTW